MKILHFVSDQSFTVSVIAFTHQLANLTHSSVTLMYVASSSKDLETGWALLAQAQEGFSDVSVKAKLEHGKADEKFLEEVSQEEYDLVVLEARRRKKFIPDKRLSMAQKILECSPISVLLVRHANFKLERMLICTSGSELSEPVVQFSSRLAAMAGLPVSLLFVSSAVPSMYTGSEVAKDTLEEILESDTPLSMHLHRCQEIFKEYKLESSLVLRHGVVTEAILEESKQGGYDLIAMGASKSKKDLSGFLLGDVTREVIDRAQSAVLVVKHAEDSSGS
jgi:nucleotide-binding universal stress UspA family protein